MEKRQHLLLLLLLCVKSLTWGLSKQLLIHCACICIRVYVCMHPLVTAALPTLWHRVTLGSQWGLVRRTDWSQDKQINKGGDNRGTWEEGRRGETKRGKRRRIRTKRFDRLWSLLIRHIPPWWPCVRCAVWASISTSKEQLMTVCTGWNGQDIQN